MGRKLLFILINLLLGFTSFAQTVITGKLLDEQQRPIANVTVSYKKIASAVILGFSRSDANGAFKLVLGTVNSDSLQIDFNHISYAKRIVHVVNAAANYVYELKSEVQKLREVKVGNVPIYKLKDTINYKVSSFTSKQDRVIADIIKKLPGIEMRGDEILYQGKSIQKYMVNNLDLMEGRYGMINNNLPADAVKNIQVVENDQPIKILDSLVFSNRASLNIELKKFTTTGNGKISLGAAPVLWDLNLTPMTFGKTFQMLNSFQTNNIGHDVSKDLRSFYTGSGYFANSATVIEGPSYISIRNVGSPSFDEKKWLDNRIFLFSTNILQKLKTGLELKANVSYYDDLRNRRGITNTQYFTDQAVISSRESVDNRYRIHVFDAGVLVEKNEKQVYLRNSLKYHRRWNNEVGVLLFNDSNQIRQRRLYQDESFLNSLSMAKFLGKQLVNIQSNLSYNSTPQSLRVNPGQFQDLLNQGNPYDQMEQQVIFKGLLWQNSIGLLRKIENWTFSPKIEINYHQHKLKTEISTQQNNQVTVLDSGYLNDMFKSELQFALKLGIGWEKRKWKFHMSIPYSSFVYNVTQQDVKALDNSIRNTLNPSANLTYLFNPKSEFSVNASTGRQYNGLENFYNGYIISQYRSMQRFNARILQTDSRHGGLSYQYKSALKGTFANASYQYAANKRDFIYNSQIDPQGRQTRSIEDRTSKSENHQLSAGASQLLASFKTILKLNGSLGWYRSDYLLNQNIIQQKVQSRSANFEIINNYSAVISGEYKTTIGQSISYFSGGQPNEVFHHNHYLNLAIYPGDRHGIMIYNSLYTNNIPGQRNQYFLDANYRYRIKKWKTDIEFIVNNCLNNSEYIQQYSSNYEFVQSYFELRPRQFLIATKFKF